MPEFFHVDRLSQMAPGQVLDLVRYADVQPPELAAHVDRLFPAGLTAHGEQHLLRNSAGLNVISPTLEVVWEYVRRTAAPNKISRYESVFAWESLPDAHRFQQAFPPSGTIWVVEAALGHRADMRLLSGVSSALVASYFAERYWAGLDRPDSTAAPWWELMLIPPVKVIRQA